MTRTRALVVWMIAIQFVAGVLGSFLVTQGQPPEVAAILFAFPMAVLLFLWCKADAAQRGIVPPSAAPLLVVLAPIGIPYYFFRALHWKRALIAMLIAILAFVLVEGAFVAGATAGQYVLGG